MIVDVAFGVHGAKGTSIPTDHRYLLYGAITQALPALHQPDVPYALHPIRGFQTPGREMELDAHSVVMLRLDHELLPAILPLAGRALRIGRSTITLGVPNVRPLKPAAALHSPLVVIKGFTEPEPFLAAAQRQVEAAGVDAQVSLLEHATTRRFEQKSAPAAGPVRRTLRIRDKEIVGFAVRVTGLLAGDSLTLQERGIGGRQHFGCGVLLPTRDS